MKYKIFAICIFLAILSLSNLFLFKDGLWLFQDLSGWPKNYTEALVLFTQNLSQFTHGYSNYFFGLDAGFLNYLLVFNSLSILILVSIFNSSLAQIGFIVFGYIITFLSFYLFSSLLFNDKKISFILSLIYTFNPLGFTLQGSVYYLSAVPLFLYSFYKYFYASGNLRWGYLLLNILSAYIWIVYVRMFVINFFVVIPILLFLVIWKKYINIKNLFIFVIVYLLSFAPLIYSLVSHFVNKSQITSGYIQEFNEVTNTSLLQAFNFFHSFNLQLYTHPVWLLVGLILFIYILYLILTRDINYKSSLFILNFSTFLFGLALYGLGTIFGNEIGSFLLSFFPFVVNGAFWAFYMTLLPFVVVLGIVTHNRTKHLLVFSSIFIILGILPLLNLSDPQLQKYDISKSPKPYQQYFFNEYTGLPEATLYIPHICWRAAYMQEANTPTHCINFGYRYSPVSFTNPRLVTGKDYAVSEAIESTPYVNNLRVTHNLKNIIFANDIVAFAGTSEYLTEEDKQALERKREELENNNLLAVNENENFSHYYFKNKDQYEFFIYSPQTVVYKDSIEDILDNSLKVEEVPVVVDSKETQLDSTYQPAHISYKVDPLNPTKYYVKVSDVDTSQPFLLQMNQSFNNNWKIKWVDKSYFEEQPCLSEWKQFSITNNHRCQYDDVLLNLADARLLVRPTLNQEQHFEGNFISNGWLIRPSDIPSNQKNQNDLYMVIVYEKQIYYAYTIAIAATAFTVLLLLTVGQEVRHKIKKT